MPYVDVQHPSEGEWTRFFLTDEEAVRYHFHVTFDRGCIATIRNDPPFPPPGANKERMEFWAKIEEERRRAKQL